MSTGGGTSRREEWQGWIVIISLLAGASVLLGLLADKYWGGVFGWVLALLAAGAAGGTAGIAAMRVRRPLPPPSRRTVLAVVAVVACLAVVYAAEPYLSRGVSWMSVQLAGCDEPVEVRVLTSDESWPVFDTLADEFDARPDHNGCLTTHLTVYSASWPRIQDAFGEGWGTAALREVGPRPDLWIADSRDQYNRIANDARELNRPTPLTADVGTFAYTPLVVGVPETRHDALAGYPTLPELAAAVPGLVRPDPSLSYVGLRHTEALYRETGPQEREAVEDRLGAASDEGGYPLGDEAAVLCHRRAATDLDAGVLTTERALVRYNAGDLAIGAACPLPAAPRVRLSALYPAFGAGEGARNESLDHILVRWTGGGSGEHLDARAAALDAFSAWLTSADGRDALLRQGLRPTGTPAGTGGIVTEEHGAAADPGASLGAVENNRLSSRLETTVDQYREARRSTEVLLAIDLSGSMDDEVDPEGHTGIEVTTDAIATQLELLQPRDRFGLWTFPHRDGGTYEELIPLGTHGGLEDTVTAALGAREPGGPGGSPVYATILAGIEHLRSTGDGAVPVLVVFTDGLDNSTAGVEDVVERAGTAGVRVFVVAVGTASCEGSLLAEIAEQSRGGCRNAQFGTSSESLRELFRLIWGLKAA